MPWRVFLSYVEEDHGTVEVFREHARTEDTELEFSEHVVKEPFDGADAQFTRVEITEQLKATTITLVCIGRTTYVDKWVDWEIRTSSSMNIGLMAVRLHPELDHIVPKALKEYKVEIHDLDVKEVVEAIEREARQLGQSDIPFGE